MSDAQNATNFVTKQTLQDKWGFTTYGRHHIIDNVWSQFMRASHFHYFSKLQGTYQLILASLLTEQLLDVLLVKML